MEILNKEREIIGFISYKTEGLHTLYIDKHKVGCILIRKRNDNIQSNKLIIIPAVKSRIEVEFDDTSGKSWWWRGTVIKQYKNGTQFIKFDDGQDIIFDWKKIDQTWRYAKEISFNCNPLN